MVKRLLGIKIALLSALSVGIVLLPNIRVRLQAIPGQLRKLELRTQFKKAKKVFQYKA